MNRERINRILYWMLPVIGGVLCVLYVASATCDVVYSDYIRLVFSYLPDVYDIKKFLVPDVLTRVPINYLERIINVELFGYSIFFERVLGIVGLTLAGWALGMYCKSRRLPIFWFILLMAVMFSLNKWEMLINGSGWSHFLAFAGFYYHEAVLDRVWAGNEKQYDRIRLCVLPWVVILLTAGPYCASYASVIILACGFCMIMECKGLRPGGRSGQPYLRYLLCAILSNAFVVEEYAGATGRPLWVILMDNPTFPIRFILKSLAGILVGGEELQTLMANGELSNKGCYFLGMFVGLGYLTALWMNFRFRLWERSIMPLMLLAGGGMNHLLVFMTRYIFEKEEYALNSSRYTLQFQVGIFGIILTFALAMQMKEVVKWLYGMLAALFCVAFLWGNVYTTYHEVDKAKYRKERFEQIKARALEVPGMTDEEFAAQADDLADEFEYWNGHERIRKAYQILEENNWNVFRD